MFDIFKRWFRSDASEDSGVVVDGDVPIGSGDPSGLLDEMEDGWWFDTHEIPLGDDTEAPTVDSSASSSGHTSRESSETTGIPSSEFESVSSENDVLFPTASGFLQALETRAKNGAQDRVETVYILTGTSGVCPEELFAVDDPTFYADATPSSVTAYEETIAQTVENAYPAGETPTFVTRLHTHPPREQSRPRPTPSDTDMRTAEMVRDQYVDAFGTDEFAFFQGVHAYAEQSDSSTPDDRHVPNVTANTVSWRGRQYRHEIGLYGPEFKDPVTVEMINAR